MKDLEKLNQQEKEMLLKAPAYFSLLAANSDGGMDEAEKKAAINFSHIKTYSCQPILREFCNEVEKVFDTNIEQLDNEFPKGKAERAFVIKKELAKLIPILEKLGDTYATALHRSFISCTEYISKARNSVIESFIIPFYIKGLTA